MKKTVTILLALVLAISLVACSPAATEDASSGADSSTDASAAEETVPSDDASAEGESGAAPRIGILFKTQNNPYFVDLSQR